MKKHDNDWSIEKDPDIYSQRIIEINGEKYEMRREQAGITHAILLLVDAINDKN